MDRKKEREGDKITERQKYPWTENRQACRQKNIGTYRQKYRQTKIQMDRKIDRQTDGLRERLLGKKMDGPIHRQTQIHRLYNKLKADLSKLT